MTMSDHGGSDNSVRITVVISATVLILGITAGVIGLSLAGRELAVIVGLIAPIGAVAGAITVALGKLVQLNTKIDQVSHQTNGGMHATIDESVHAAVDRHMGGKS